MKHLLIVYHTKTGNTGRLARAALDGASCDEVGEVAVRCLTARQAGPRDLLWANALLIGTPEYLGYMSGAMKDFIDRTFYELEGKLQPLPCAIFISAGNDGSGALRALRRIINGYPFEEVQEPLIARGRVTGEHLERCRELGMALAVGLEAGIY